MPTLLVIIEETQLLRDPVPVLLDSQIDYKCVHYVLYQRINDLSYWCVGVYFHAIRSVSCKLLGNLLHFLAFIFDCYC
ncbi:hypothetical protein D3C76_129350 [compost metagenome]